MSEPLTSKEQLLADALVALEDLSFECCGGIWAKAPSVEVYNRTFKVLERVRGVLGVSIARDFRPLDEPPAECIHNWADHPKVARWLVCTKCRDVYEPDVPAEKGSVHETSDDPADQADEVANQMGLDALAEEDETWSAEHPDAGAPLKANEVLDRNRDERFVGHELVRDPNLIYCSDCPPIGYPTDKTRCSQCPRRSENGKSAHLTTGE